MLLYMLKRIGYMILILILMSMLVFAAVRLAPGDPAVIMLAQTAGPEEIEAMRRSLGLDKPIYVQYAIFVRDIVEGNLGISIYLKRPVIGLVFERMPNTLRLAFFTMAWILAVSIPAGIYGAIRRGGIFDTFSRIFIYLGQAAPNFWLGIMLILVFAVKLRWLPSFGSGTIKHMILPSLALGIPLLSRETRFTRIAILDVLSKDYMRTARSKGLPERVVMGIHAFRNALIPITTDSGMQLGWLIANAVVVEVVFAWPGVGSLAIEAIVARDYPLVQACVLFLAAIFIFLVFVVDIVYTYIDPRIKYG